jgi:hypothetical protein
VALDPIAGLGGPPDNEAHMPIDRQHADLPAPERQTRGQQFQANNTARDQRQEGNHKLPGAGFCLSAQRLAPLVHHVRDRANRKPHEKGINAQ